MDPIWASAIKAGFAAAPAVYKAARREFDRREIDPSWADPANLERQMNEALDVLVGKSDKAHEAFLNAIKAVLSDRPPVFDTPSVKAWLAPEETRRAVREAAKAVLTKQDAEAIGDAAVAAYALEQDDRDGAPAAVAFHYAVGFVVVSLARDLTVGERLIIQEVRAQGGEMRELLHANADRLDRLLGVTPAPSPFAQGLIDREAEAEVEAFRRLRFVMAPSRPSQAALALGKRLFAGDLASASGRVRALALAHCARWAFTELEPETADAWLAPARDFTTDADAAVLEAARIAGAFLRSRSDWQSALADLSPIDSPATRMAAMQIRLHHEGREASVAWAVEAGVDVAALDSDGRYVLLASQTQTGAWDAAIAGAAALEAADFARTPALYAEAASTSLAQAVADGIRYYLIGGAILLHPADFDLADTPEGLAARRRAADLYDAAAEAACEAGNVNGSNYYSSMALWLKLRDPGLRASAEAAVQSALDDPSRSLAVLPLALAFELPLNREAAERDLRRREALSADGDAEAAFARFALANHQADAAAAVDYLRRHRGAIDRHLSFDGVTGFEVRALVAADRPDDAASVLNAARDRLSEELIADLEQIIARRGPDSSLDDAEAAFAAKPGLATRGFLIEQLCRIGYSDRVVDLWLDHVGETQSAMTAERLAAFMNRHRARDRMPELLDRAAGVLASSPELRSEQGWIHYRQGRFAEALGVAEALILDRDDVNDRALKVSALIAAGDWPELVGHIEAEWTRRADRSAQELLGLAELASRAGSGRVMGFLEAATVLEPENPNVLLAAYSLAIRIGQDAHAQANLWLGEAIDRSGDEGPIRKVELNELMDQAPDWNARVDHVWTLLRTAQLPMGLAAPALRRVPLDLQLVPMIANRRETDPRKRSVIPTYSGRRGRPALTAGTLGLDMTALVTLAVVGELDRVIARGRVVVAHDVMRSLFEQRRGLSFHQPSRIVEAHALIQALALQQIRVFSAAEKADGPLSALVGYALAEMIGEAGRAAAPVYVVRPGPVDRAGSLRQDPVDLSEHASVLRSCQSVVDTLVAAGRLTAAEEEQARAFLGRQNDERWSSDEAIEAGATLYVDDLALSYLRTTGLFDRLQGAGFQVFVSEHERDEARALLGVEQRSAEIEAVIEGLRLSLGEAIKQGQVTVCGDLRDLEDDADNAFAQRVFALAAAVDILVCDDRFFNQHASFEANGRQTPIWTSLDLLDYLESGDRMTRQERYRARTVLRQCGLTVFPHEADELRAHIATATLRKGQFTESAELRAFRENLALNQMRGWLKLPDESDWLQRMSTDVVTLIAEQWTPNVPDDDARRRSEWLLERIDLRNWSEMITDHDAADMAQFGRAWQLARLAIGMFDPPDPDAYRRYMLWLADQVESIQAEDLTAYHWMLDTLRRMTAAYHRGKHDGR